MTESKQTFIRIVQLGLIIFGIVFFINFDRQSPTLGSVPPNSANHTIKQNEYFRPLWDSGGVVSCHTCLQSYGNDAILIGNLSGEREVNLIRFNITTKEIKWRTTDSFGPMWVDNDLIYTAAGGRARVYYEAQTIGTASVTAYDPLTGTAVWSNTVYGARSIPFLSSNNNVVSAVGQQYINLTHMNAETGTRLKVPDTFVPIIYSDENITLTYRWFFSGGQLQALDANISEILWQKPIQIGTFAVEEGILVINSTRDKGLGEVIAIDLATGEVKWRYNGVISNVAVDKSKVYFFRLAGGDEWGESIMTAATIPVIDLHSGERITTLNFIPEAIRPWYGANPYNVFARNDTVILYFGDSSQLFAFKFISPRE